MSDTPRTDEAWSGRDMKGYTINILDFARQLERELAAVTAELLALRAESKALCEQVLSHNRTIAALVMQAGGEVRVDDLTIAMLPLDAEILTWSEPMERKTVVQVRTPKRQNKK